ncbi:hypothetical protein VAEKB19_1060002 [Vibrio aestuarianus]|nr:hypothetical protein VAEKB19_1060002 [Vibrio aestuarianus]
MSIISPISPSFGRMGLAKHGSRCNEQQLRKTLKEQAWIDRYGYENTKCW